MPHLSRVLFLLPCLSGALTAQVPKGFAKVDHEIEIGMLPGRLRFDVEKFTVRPGSKVRLVLSNNDEMQHNLVICERGEGVLARITAGALALGGQASAKHFVPNLPEVLHHTSAIMPGKTDTIWFRAPKERGDYPFICTLPGHTFTMRGVMTVGDIAPSLVSRMRYAVIKGKFKFLADMQKLSPTKTGVVKTGVMDIGALGETSDFGVRFTADLFIAKAGKYSFYLRSDDGSRVSVNGKQVVADDGIHGVRKEQKGEVELAAGQCELCVEFFQGGGGKALHVDIEGPGLKRRALTATTAPKPTGLPIPVLDENVVMRVHLENGSARSIAVGFPGGMNCAFDANTCRMQFGWAGAFVDVAPDRLGRGGRPCRTLGKRFRVGDIGFPLRRGGRTDRPVRFRGYRTADSTKFVVDWDGIEVSWAVKNAPSGVGLQYTFEIPKIEESVQFVVDPAGLELASDAGAWRGGVLDVPAAKARRFTVTLTRSAGEVR